MDKRCDGHLVEEKAKQKKSTDTKKKSKIRIFQLAKYSFIHEHSRTPSNSTINLCLKALNLGDQIGSFRKWTAIEHVAYRPMAWARNQFSVVLMPIKTSIRDIHDIQGGAQPQGLQYKALCK